MKTGSMSKLSCLWLGGFLIFLLSACTTTPSTQNAQEQEAAKQAEPAEPIEPWEGDGMLIPLDGSSLEAFERSLARVQAHARPSTYTTLLNAIEYLMVYDLSAQRDRAKLAANLDGLNGYEVIDKVKWRKY